MVQAFIWENKIFLTVMLDTFFLSSGYMFIYLESQLREEEIYIDIYSKYSNLVLSFKKYVYTHKSLLVCLGRKAIHNIWDWEMIWSES